MTALTPTDDAAPAWVALGQVLAALARPTPCQVDPATFGSDDYRDRDEAAQACLSGCPVPRAARQLLLRRMRRARRRPRQATAGVNVRRWAPWEGAPVQTAPMAANALLSRVDRPAPAVVQPPQTDPTDLHTHREDHR